MGSLCCCLPVEYFEGYGHPNSATCRNCLCISCFAQQFLNGYTSLFQSAGMHASPSTIPGATPLGSVTPSIDNSIPDTYRPPPRPLPYDFDPRFFHLHHAGRLSRHEKATSHDVEESKLLRSSSRSEPPGMVDKWSNSLMKRWSSKMTNEELQALSSSEDEVVCPTCLEEYTPENPKIITQCSHHFHLSCIYEWKERSESCPICGKVMAFKETN